MRCFRFDKLQIFFTCLQVVESRSDPNLSDEERFPVMTMACGLIYQELVDTVAKLEQELTARLAEVSRCEASYAALTSKLGIDHKKNLKIKTFVYKKTA